MTRIIKAIKSIISTNKEGFKCKYTCMVATPYALSLYLIYMPENALEETFFCVYDQIKSDITSKLPHVRTFNHLINANKNTLWTFRIKSLFEYFFIKYTDIYAMDFIDFAPQLIDHSKYTCIEDGTGCFSFAEKSNVLAPFTLPHNLWGFKRRLQHGKLYGKRMGVNSQCVNRLITSPNDIKSALIRGRNYTLVDLKKEWRNASAKKKETLMKVFGIEETIFNQIQRCTVIVLTQTLGSKITEDEKIAIYAPYVAKYQDKGVVIKPHPAETTDYKHYFPEAIIWNTKAPMQIYDAMGIKFDIAVTIFSTAVGTLPKETQIIWLGTEVNEKLFNDVGPITLEQVRGKQRK